MKIHLLEGDITQLSVDAIVNAANSSLLGGGGVDGAIHRAAGKELLNACREIRRRDYPEGLPVGEAVITPGFNLPAKYVIHTVGPVWRGGNFQEEILLKKAYENSLKLGEKHCLRSIAFPNISTGVYRFPKERAADIAIQTIRNFAYKCIEEVFFVVFDEVNKKIYKNKLKDDLFV